MSPNDFMREALVEAQKALKFNEVPIGAVVVYKDLIIGRGYNTRESDEYALSHAEINAIREASKVMGGWRLTDCDIYVTIEPCPMCCGAIFQSRIRSITYGAPDPKAGACGSIFNLFELNGLNHYATIQAGVLEEECKALMQNFFKERRS
ncbi:nucleoside deaminase [Fusibacter tunisiensis]|uniref:tRNA-specific adenosine deaminase n=1 Tax=Fusibacter tunisiensis TaxID=1008308 RepID=A0ABS2MNM4_9FIRM|nr:nucleoside deaminase [Fusibacter tunisiensis]MBM7560988.1 tRNA(adenine34) deaminase [Fusibacter tunisiensis]